MFVVSKENDVLFLLVHAYAVKQPTKNSNRLQYNFLSMQYRTIQGYEKTDKGSETCDGHR